jgi:hypothetical protein
MIQSGEVVPRPLLHTEEICLFCQKQLCTRLVKVTAVIETLMLPVSACSGRDCLAVGRFGETIATHERHVKAEFRVR